jgi:two-component system, OmpR family, sensor histidine kinase BaeS
MSRGWGPPPDRRPPWWPDGEPFPPYRWRRSGAPSFLRWVGCLFLGALLVAAVMGGFAGAAFGRQGPHPFFPFFLFPILFVVLIVVVAAGGMRRVTGPMNNLIDAARRIESGDYSARVPESGSRDIRSVARAFNSMSERLKAIDEQRRNFVADVTHELRTPLSVIRGQAEAIADGLYPADAVHLAPILDATQTLDRLVEDLRTLILSDAGNLVLRKEPTDLGTLVQETVDSFKTQAETARVSLSSEIADELPTVEVDPARIRSVVGNLLSNAIRHTPSGGSVSVGVKQAAERIAITVKDNGEGIPPELLPHVFERFVKGPTSTGSGLGLAIAHDIIAAHGGTLEIQNAPGSGTVATVGLPER